MSADYSSFRIEMVIIEKKSDIEAFFLPIIPNRPVRDGAPNL